MFEIFLQEKMLSFLMFFFLMAGIGSRVWLGILYQHMINETENMSSTKNKQLKQCKLKFTNCYELNKGVANIPVFVDKFMNHLTAGNISFLTLYHLSGQLVLLSVCVAGLAVCRNIATGKSLYGIMPFYVVSLLGLYLFFSVSAIADIKGRRRVLKINLVDFLENHMINRLSEAEISKSLGTVELMPINGLNRVRGQAEGRDRSLSEHELDRDLPSKDQIAGQLSSMADEKELEELLKEFINVC